MNYKLINFCEIDPYASQSYCRLLNINSNLNLKDVTNLDLKNVSNFDLLVGGSPCQSFSIAGKIEGAKYQCNECNFEFNPLKINYEERNKCYKCKSKNLSKSKSSLIINYLDILREKNPKFAIFENVKNLINKGLFETFNLFITEIQSLGYNTYYKVLNAKNFGVPQNRERLFLIIIRKDLDNGKFQFPVSIKNKIYLNNVLQKNIENKWFVNDNLTKQLLKEINKDYLKSLNYPICCSSRGRYFLDKNNNIYTKQCLELNKNEVTNTITSVIKDNYILDIIDNEFLNYDSLVLRKLTPLECFRLMSFSDEDYDIIKYYTNNELKNIKNKNKLKTELDENNNLRYVYLSDTQAYKQAANSIVVNILIEIFKNLKFEMPYLFEDLNVFSIFSGIGAFEKALNII